MAGKTTAPLLDNRALNRATLARQMLLKRQEMSVEKALEHLIGLQGQTHNAPYVGLWSRLEHFTIADLEKLLNARDAVRATLQRGTLHVTTARDYLAMRPLLQPLMKRIFAGNFGKQLRQVEVDEIRDAGRRLLGHTAMSASAIGKALGERWPDEDSTALGMVMRHLEPLLHVPPAGLWGATKAPKLMMAKAWLGREPGKGMTLKALVLRYLEAFGPASKVDFTAWCGITASDAFEDLRSRLAVFRSDDGRELFDLEDAPPLEVDAEAPARLLAAYDNVILGYAERGRIIDPRLFGHVATRNGIFFPTFTVDGFVRGIWKLVPGDAPVVELRWFEVLSAKDRAALTLEAQLLLQCFAAGSRGEVRFAAFA
ncbi:MAG TPA: winged helix DNA-binding domain-containing protein [Devosiaceae bacterium]|jgi:hypothetical protein